MGPADDDIPRVTGTLLLRVVPKLTPQPGADKLRLARRRHPKPNPNTKPGPKAIKPKLRLTPTLALTRWLNPKPNPTLTL